MICNQQQRISTCLGLGHSCNEASHLTQIGHIYTMLDDFCN